MTAMNGSENVTEQRAYEQNKKCSSPRKLVILLLVSSCYNFGIRGIDSVVCPIVLSKGNKADRSLCTFLHFAGNRPLQINNVK